MQRLADNFIFRKIKRLHKTTSGRSIESESETEHFLISNENKGKINRILSAVKKSPKKSEKLEECITKSFVLQKFFDSELFTHSISLKTSKESAEIFENSNRRLSSSVYETPTNSFIEANEEVKEVLKNNNLILDENKEESFKSFKKNSKEDLILRHPRSLDLPNKLTYKGQPINVEISGPVHFLTANVFNNKNSKIKENIDNNVSTSLEKYVETLCDFSQIVSKLTEKLNSQNNLLLETTSKDKIQKNKDISQPKYSYKIASSQKCTKYESPLSVPFLAKSNSHTHQAKVTDITQEWHLIYEPVTAIVNGLFPGYLLMISLKDTTERAENNQLYSNLTMPRINKNKKLSLLHKTQSTAWKSSSFVIDSNKYDALKETIRQVEEDLNFAKIYKDSQNIELKQIENAIWMISERIAKNEPVSKAQAQLNEELLRTKLAEMILNLGPEQENETYDYGILKEPIIILKDKLQFLESFMEEEDSIKEELQSIKELPEQNKHNSNMQKKAEALKRRRDEIARMTPLIAVVKNKLVNLEEVVEVDENQKSGRNTPYMERKTIHNLLVSINQEINVIHDLCRKNNQLESLNAVVEVLSRMCIHLDTIIDTLKLYKTSTEEVISQYSKQETKELITNQLMDSKKITLLNKNISTVEDKIIEVNSNVDMQKDEEEVLVNTFILNSGIFKTKIEPRSKIVSKFFLDRRSSRSSKKSFDLSELSKTSFKKSKETILSEAILTKSLKDSLEYKNYEKEEKPLQIEKLHTLKNNYNEFQTESGYLTPVYGLKNKEKVQHFRSNLSEKSQGINVKLQKREENLSLILTLPMGVLNMQMSQYIFDEHCLMHMMCEESDGALSVEDKQFLKNSNNIVFNQEDKIDKIYSEYGDLYKMISIENSPIPFSKISYIPSKTENNILFKPKFNLNSGNSNKINIMQIKSNLNLENSLVSNIDEDDISSRSENVPILFRNISNDSSFSVRETAIISDEDDSSIVQIYNLISSCTETFDLRHRRKHALLNAIIFPEIRAQISAKFLGDSFQVDIERMSETGRDSVVMVSEEYYNKRVKILKKNIANNQLMLNEPDQNENDDDDDDDKSVFVDTLAKLNVSILARSLKDVVYVDLEEIPWDEITANLEVPKEENIMNQSRMSIRSGKSETTIRDNGSIVFNIIVAENHDEARSVASRRSIEPEGGSQKSLASSQKTLHSQTSFENIDIPTYIIKQGATASITCELNHYVDQGLKIEWYKGKEHIKVIPDKYDRVTHDLLELLIILHVNKDDGAMYSIRVNDQMYPVAYLIIEDAQPKINREDDFHLNGEALRENRFLSFPQTMFVMQGQTAILSCQMFYSNLRVNWYHEQDLLEAGQDDRIYFEKNSDGWYKIIIEDVDFVDQGTYYACFEEMTTSITLVVEGYTKTFIKNLYKEFV